MAEIKAYILCKVNSGTAREVCDAISGYSDVLEVAMLYGEYDIIVTLQSESLQKLDFINDKIRMIPNIIFTSTMIVSRKCKPI